MPLAIITSDAQSRHSLLFILSITAVFTCICTKVLLVLTALRMIFIEPDEHPVIQDHVTNFHNNAHLLSGRFLNDSDDSKCAERDIYEYLL